MRACLYTKDGSAEAPVRTSILEFVRRHITINTMMPPFDCSFTDLLRKKIGQEGDGPTFCGIFVSTTEGEGDEDFHKVIATALSVTLKEHSDVFVQLYIVGESTSEAHWSSLLKDEPFLVASVRQRVAVVTFSPASGSIEELQKVTVDSINQWRDSSPEDPAPIAA